MTSDENLWDFANRLYAVSGVSDACLGLQDAHGVDVCVLMLLLWIAQRRRALRATQVHMILRSSAPWRDDIVHPLRRLRRTLKAPPSFVDADDCESLRTAIKAAELKAERLELNALQALFGEGRLSQETPDALSAARINIESYASALNAAFTPNAVGALLRGVQEVV